MHRVALPYTGKQTTPQKQMIPRRRRVVRIIFDQDLEPCSMAGTLLRLCASKHTCSKQLGMLSDLRNRDEHYPRRAGPMGQRSHDQHANMTKLLEQRNVVYGQVLTETTSQQMTSERMAAGCASAVLGEARGQQNNTTSWFTSFSARRRHWNPTSGIKSNCEQHPPTTSCEHHLQHL